MYTYVTHYAVTHYAVIQGVCETPVFKVNVNRVCLNVTVAAPPKPHEYTPYENTLAW